MTTLREARERKGLELGDVARLLGISSKTLAKWEAEPGQIRLNKFVALCRCYDVSVNDVDIMATNAD